MYESAIRDAAFRRAAQCVFCGIVARTEPAQIVAEWPYALAIVPHHPVTNGHVLVIPKRHVTDFTEDPETSALVMKAAAEMAVPPANVITSAGEAATQTVFHLHLHIVPRRDGDGLMLPWTDQHDREQERAEGRRAEDARWRYPEGRPGWLSEFQSWPCARCGSDVDDSEKHRCVPHPCGDYPAPCNHDPAHEVAR